MSEISVVTCDCCGSNISRKEDYGEISLNILTWRGAGCRGVNFDEDGEFSVRWPDVCVGCYRKVFDEYCEMTGRAIEPEKRREGLVERFIGLVGGILRQWVYN